MVKKRFNVTSEDGFVKTTVNLRPQMMRDVHVRMIELQKEDFIHYLRDLIHLDTKYKILGQVAPIGLKEFRHQIGWPKKETALEVLQRILREHPYQPTRNPRPYGGPPKKFPGFIAGLQFWPKLQHFRKRRQKWELEQMAVKEESAKTV